MLKQTRTYVDYDGNERTEDFYFNISKAELMEMELSTSGGMEQMIKSIIAAQDMPKVISLFKEIVLKAYGVKSPDGKRFIKNDDLREEFMQTEAYSDLFMELATDSEKASAFINGVMPKDIQEEVKKNGKNNPALAEFPTV